MSESGGDPVGVAGHLLQVNQPRRALDVLSGLGGEALESSHVWWLRASALLELEERQEAAELARQAVGRWPEDVALLDVLARAEAELDRLGEAERAVLAALRLAPDDADLLARYAHILMRGGQLTKARAVLDLAERTEPDALSVWRNRLLLAFLRADKRAAREEAGRLLAEDPDDKQALVILGAMDLEDVRPGRALERLGPAVRDDPSSTGIARAARAAKVMRSPLAWPLIPFNRFGPGPTWVAAIAIIFGLRAAGLGAASTIASIVWLALCVYSWTVGTWLERRAKDGW